METQKCSWAQSHPSSVKITPSVIFGYFHCPGYPLQKCQGFHLWILIWTASLECEPKNFDQVTCLVLVFTLVCYKYPINALQNKYAPRCLPLRTTPPCFLLEFHTSPIGYQGKQFSSSSLVVLDFFFVLICFFILFLIVVSKITSKVTV